MMSESRLVDYVCSSHINRGAVEKFSVETQGGKMKPIFFKLV